MQGGHAVHEAVRAFVDPNSARNLAAGPLPSHVIEVLKLAARSDEALDKWSEELRLPRERLADMAVFFIEQVLMTRSASHYRVLGVEPDATPTRIKAHYRLLMSWLHPDRPRSGWHGILAQRVNGAYAELKDPERRAAYDRQLQQQLPARFRPPPARPAAPPSRPPPPTGPPVLTDAAGEDEPAPLPTLDGEPYFDPEHVETVVLEGAPPQEPPPREPVVDWHPTWHPVTPERPPRTWPLPAAIIAAAVIVAVALIWVTSREQPPQEPVALALPEPAPASEADVVAAKQPPELPEAVPVEPAASEETPPPSALVASAVEPATQPVDEAPAAREPERRPPPTTTAAAVPATVAPPPVRREPVQAPAPQIASARATPPPAPVVAPEPEPEPALPPVTAEARALAVRLGGAYVAGDFLTVLNLVNSSGQLTPAELAATAEDVQRWGRERRNAPVSVAGTQPLPPLTEDGPARAAIELRTPDAAGLRVVVQQAGEDWRIERAALLPPPDAAQEPGL